jgi:predicted RNase H-like HicB family nuclease
MLDYLAVAFRHPTGSWAAVMPDFIGITGRGSDASAAIQKAKAGASAMLSILKRIPESIPVPMDIGAAQRNPILTKHYGVDWSQAVVDTVSFDDERDTLFPGALIGPETGMGDGLGRHIGAGGNESSRAASVRQRRAGSSKAARWENGEYAATDRKRCG